MQAKTLAVLGTLVAALFVVSLVFISKYNEMSSRLVQLDKKVRYLESKGEQVRPTSTIPPGPPPVAGSSEALTPSPVSAPVASPAAPAAVRGPAPEAPDEPLTAHQEEAVAKIVEKVVKEKFPNAAELDFPKNPMTVLERELDLSEQQKMRIGELFKQRDAESEALSQELGKAMMEGKTPDFRDMVKRFGELETRYNELIKKELDVSQQQKYDELLKKGALPGGNVKVRMGISGK